MITENLSTLKIHKLTQKQYERELAAGRIDENALYLTPDEEADLSEYVTTEQLTTAIANADHLKREIVTELPNTGDINTIYMIQSNTASENNIYLEYMYINDKWEIIGSSEVDLTNYVKNIDYATQNKGGVVKIHNGYGMAIGEQGTIYPLKATQEHIDSRSNDYNPIVSSNLEYAVKSVGDGYYIKNTDTLDETYLKWGTKSVAGDMGVIDASFLDESGGNRFAYMPADDIYIEYSRDGGSTWTAYPTTDNAKTSLTTLSQKYYVGGCDIDNYTCDINCQLRVTLTASPGKIYTKLKRILMYISREGAQDCWCTIEKALGGSDTTFTTVTEKTKIDGYGGWNSLPCDLTFGGSASQTSQVRKIRLTIGYDRFYNGYSNRLYITKLRAIGPTNYNNLNPLMHYGHAYTYNLDKSVKFMGDVIDSSNNKMSEMAATIKTLTDKIADLEAQLAGVEAQLSEI